VIGLLTLLIGAALTGAGMWWVTKEDDPSSDRPLHSSDYDLYHNATRPRPRVNMEKYSEYNEGARTLTETMTTTKVFPDVDPWDLDEEDEDV